MSSLFRSKFGPEAQKSEIWVGSKSSAAIGALRPRTRNPRRIWPTNHKAWESFFQRKLDITWNAISSLLLAHTAADFSLMATLSLYFEDKPLRPDINNPGRDRYLGLDQNMFMFNKQTWISKRFCFICVYHKPLDLSLYSVGILVLFVIQHILDVAYLWF